MHYGEQIEHANFSTVRCCIGYQHISGVHRCLRTRSTLERLKVRVGSNANAKVHRTDIASWAPTSDDPKTGVARSKLVTGFDHQPSNAKLQVRPVPMFTVSCRGRCKHGNGFPGNVLGGDCAAQVPPIRILGRTQPLERSCRPRQRRRSVAVAERREAI